MHVFGEVGIVYISKKTKLKLENHGIPCLSIGYPDDHGKNVFKFYDPKTNGCLLSHTVIWANIGYGDYFSNQLPKGLSSGPTFVN